jgi:hypothetical protein
MKGQSDRRPVVKDLDEFDLHGKRRAGDPEAAPELEDPGQPEEAPEAWGDDGPSRLDDDAEGLLPELTPDVGEERPLIPPLTWLLLVLIAVPVVLYLLLRPEEPELVAPPELAATPLGLAPAADPETDATTEAAPALDLPPLDESDGALRELLAGLSGEPGLVAWLGQEQLVRTFVVVVENVADGESPRPHLAFLAPDGGFKVRDTPSGPVVDPGSFARYDALTRTLTSLDAVAVARRVRQLEPLTEAAYRELGHPEGGFGKTLRRALDRLIATPVPAAGAALSRHSVSYAWADPRLEALTPPQKHLLRTGPQNQAAIQRWLRALRDALTAPAGDDAEPPAATPPSED